MQSQFFSGAYLSVEKKGNVIRAKKPETIKEENAVPVKTQEIDLVDVDPKETLVSLGFVKKDNQTIVPSTEVKYIPPSMFDYILEGSSGMA